MEKQYLLVAEQMIFRNNRLTAINIWDQLTAIHSPAKFNFDLAFICGPSWQPGEYDLKFKIKAVTTGEEFEVGAIKVKITSEQSVFNAIASNVNIAMGEESGNVIFIVERDGQEIYSREYPVVYFYKIKQESQEAQEPVEA
ncbi:MAG: hypothetical protein A2287_08180 [Candidatus Melainabacteria bacterium RIFOXYA12_FULL_32_12]|nr:MAG: hypothetical protein A2104_05975 [Candidatus Melainabacteria bacterium GWF2_32_7]OGI22661.1 MAG: hypothetical protein A2255_01970 [Candidatus Melainabacteria bacterium RIFOXYA2_FULL_32_9]OGI31766.1 MAG: hypothetical protein A2287_08180 [Candidatus Melainabacteria bacterium RIFOXYA12_FULL_32_12]